MRTHSTTRRPAALAVLLSLLILLTSTPGAADCSRWESRFGRYEEQVYEAILDEPEDLVQELERFTKAWRNDAVERSARIENKIRNGLSGLREIRPHPEMAKFHTDLIEYYTHGVDVIDAEQSGNSRQRRSAEISTWQSFRAFFVTLRRILADHDCDEGDIEAIDRKFLPHIAGR
jgi:hypothetical protein